MKNSQIKNAKIESTFLGWEDHGIFTYNIVVSYGGSSQGFGQRALDEPIHNEKDEFLCRQGTAWGMEMVISLLRVVGVGSWEKLAGTPVRVKIKDGLIVAIGHYLEENWLEPTDLYKKMNEENDK